MLQDGVIQRNMSSASKLSHKSNVAVVCVKPHGFHVKLFLTLEMTSKIFYSAMGLHSVRQTIHLSKSWNAEPREITLRDCQAVLFRHWLPLLHQNLLSVIQIVLLYFRLSMLVPNHQIWSCSLSISMLGTNISRKKDCNGRTAASKLKR